MDDFLKYMQNYGQEMPANIQPSPAMPEQPVPDMPIEPQAPEGVDPRIATAIQERDRRERMAMLLNSARQLAQAGATASGSKVQLDNSAADMMAKRAQNPMQDARAEIQAEQAQQNAKMSKEKHDAIMADYSLKLDKANLDITNAEKIRDPQSAESVFAQDFAMSINPKLNEQTVRQMSGEMLYKYVQPMQSLVVEKMRADRAGVANRLQERSVAAREERNAIMREKEEGVGGRFAKSHDLRVDKFGNQKKEKDEDQRAKVADVFEKDKVVQNSNVMSSGSDNALALLSSDNPIADKAVVNFMVKASGETGALTESDKKPFGGSQALSARVAQVMEEWNSGQLTPENRDFLKSLASTMKKASIRNKARRAMELVPKQAKAYSMDEKSVTDLMMPGLSKFEGEDRDAVEWALKNPEDPKAEKILQLHGL